MGVAKSDGLAIGVGVLTGFRQFGSASIQSHGQRDAYAVAYSPQSSVVSWRRSYGGDNDDSGQAVAACSGNVYITGSYEGSTFRSGSWTPSPALNSQGQDDVFVLSTKATNGAPQWAISGGGTGNDVGRAIACSGATVYVTGQYTGTMTMKGSNSATSSAITSSGGNDVFIASITSAGVIDWLKSAGGSGNDGGYGLSLDSSVLYVTGSFATTATFGSGGSAKSLQAPTGKEAGFVYAMKLSDQQPKWMQKIDSASRLNACTYGLYNGGTVYVAGKYSRNTNSPVGTGAFGTSTTLPASNSDSEDYVVASLSPSDGAVTWAKTGGADSDDEVLAVDYSAGNVIVTGYYTGMSAVIGGVSNNVPSATMAATTFLASLTADAGALVYASIIQGDSDAVKGRGLVTLNSTTFQGIESTQAQTVTVYNTASAIDMTDLGFPFWDGSYNGVQVNQNGATLSEAGAVVAAYHTGCGFLMCPVVATSKTDTWMRIQWNKGDYAFTSYQLRYRKQGASTWSTVTGTERNSTMAGLTPYTVYEVQARGQQSGTWSSYSPSGSIMTKATPAGATGIPTATDKSQQYLKVAFTPSSLPTN